LKSLEASSHASRSAQRVQICLKALELLRQDVAATRERVVRQDPVWCLIATTVVSGRLAELRRVLRAVTCQTSAEVDKSKSEQGQGDKLDEGDGGGEPRRGQVTWLGA
jgi:hypothetical protein